MCEGTAAICKYRCRRWNLRTVRRWWRPTCVKGNGTVSLVWTSSGPADAGRSMRYVNLMGRDKPYLLVRSWNNLGAETRVSYAPSTAFYLADRAAGTP